MSSRRLRATFLLAAAMALLTACPSPDVEPDAGSRPLPPPPRAPSNWPGEPRVLPDLPPLHDSVTVAPPPDVPPGVSALALPARE